MIEIHNVNISDRRLKRLVVLDLLLKHIHANFLTVKLYKNYNRVNKLRYAYVLLALINTR